MPESDARPHRLPVNHELTRAQAALSGLAMAIAFILVGTLAARIAINLDRGDWWASGQRLLRPFRVHHVNPEDFLRRRFVDTNGDVAMLAVPILIVLFRVPADTKWGRVVAVFGLSFSGVGMMTNQIHQWAHMPSPPRLVGCCNEWA